MSFLARNALRGFAIACSTITIKPRSLSTLPRIPTRSTRQLWTPIFARKFASESPTSLSEDAAANETSLSTETAADETITESPSQSEVENTTFPNRTPSSTLYAGNLFFEVTDDQLRREFEKIGEVKSAKVVQDHRGLSKGYGYIEFQNQADAARAIEALNQREFEGRRMVVQYHIQRVSKISNIEPQPPSRTLFIGNLSFEMSDRDLNDLFRDIKNVLDVRVAIDRRSGQPRGFAHADFIDIKSAEQAKDVLDGKEIYGRRLRVDFSSTAKDRAARAA